MLHCQIDAGGQAVQMGFGGGFHPEEKLKTRFVSFLALINFHQEEKLRTVGFNKFPTQRQGC